MPSDSEDNVSLPEKPAVSSGGAKVRGGAVISDDDEESDLPVPGRRRAKAKGGSATDTEMSLRTMMDIDDGSLNPSQIVVSKSS